jgi:hypothetical protein
VAEVILVEGAASIVHTSISNMRTEHCGEEVISRHGAHIMHCPQSIVDEHNLRKVRACDLYNPQPSMIHGARPYQYEDGQLVHPSSTDYWRHHSYY